MYATNLLKWALMFSRRFWDADPVSIVLLMEVISTLFVRYFILRFWNWEIESIILLIVSDTPIIITQHYYDVCVISSTDIPLYVMLSKFSRVRERNED
jgi:hypothetical protein